MYNNQNIILRIKNLCIETLRASNVTSPKSVRRQTERAQIRYCRRPLAHLSPCFDTPSYQREEQRHHLGAYNPNASVDNNLGEHYIKSQHRIPHAEQNKTKQESAPSAS